MTISTTQIVDILYKKLSGVSKTDTASAKSPANEANASPQLSPGSTIWQQDYLIPAVNVLPTANSAVVTVYRDTLTSTVQAVSLSESVANETWATGLTNWIPPQFGPGYQVKLYAGPAGSTNPQTLTNLPVGGSGNSDSWYFDYAAGIVNFADTNVPTAVAGNVVYVVGARYTGITGIGRFGNLTVGNISVNGNTLTGNALGITMTGNVTTGNVLTSGLFYPNGNAYIFGSTYGNANVAAYLPIYGGNILANTITVDNIAPNNNPVTVFNAVTAVGIPAGSTDNRPTPAAGYMRFNSDTLSMEYYDSAAWVSITNTILDQQLVPDGTSKTYSLDQTSTQVGIIVSINGTLQHPGTAYTVNGDQITFTETPLVTDLVDIRFLGQAVTIDGNIGSNYSDSDVATYLPTDLTIQTIKANLGAFETYANATFGTSNYGNTQVSAYLTANPQGSTYSNANVASYLVANPQGSTYSNANVASYLVANPQTGTYSNANVASYLVANPQGSTYSNANVVANLQNLTTNVKTTGNITAGKFIGDGSSLTNVTVSVAGNILGTGTNVTLIAGSYSTVFANNGVATFPGSITATGTITGDNLTSNAEIAGYGALTLGNITNATATKTRIVSFGSNSYIQTGNGVAGSTGNIIFSPTLDATPRVTIDTSSGTLSATGNITGTNLTSKTTGSWTVTTGTNTYSFTVPINGNYQIWVRCNIPNGIIAYQATVSVTNTNVPVLGTQRAWNYTGGGSPILLTTMPTQIVGAEGTISTAVVSTTTANRFDFGISNASGSSQTVSWGYVRLD